MVTTSFVTFFSLWFSHYNVVSHDVTDLVKDNAVHKTLDFEMKQPTNSFSYEKYFNTYSSDNCCLLCNSFNRHLLNLTLNG